MEHKILTFLLVPYTFHIYQLLNNSIFGPLKHIPSGKLNQLFQLDITRIQKLEWLTTFYSMYQQVFNHKNITSGFSNMSIYPFNPNQVLNHLLKPHDITPLIPLTPSINLENAKVFNLNDLKSSPVNFLTLHSKNTKFNTLLHDSNLLPINVQECVWSVTSTSEKLYVQNSFLTEHLRQLSEALTK